MFLILNELNLIKKVRLLVLMAFSSVVAQQQHAEDTYKEFLNLYQSEDYAQLIVKERPTVSAVKRTERDSLLVSKALHILAKGYYQLKHYRNALFLYNQALQICPTTKLGTNQKGQLLFDKALLQYHQQDYLVSLKTVKQAEQLFKSLKAPNYNYLLSIYAELSSTSTYYGFFDEAEYYLKKGMALYHENLEQLQVPNEKNQVSSLVTFHHKLVYLYSREGDENKMLEALNEFKMMKASQSFNSEEQRLFALSLNHVGDFYLNFRDKLTKKKPLIQGKSYLLKAIKALDVKQYPDDYIEIKFNLVKQLRYSQNFEEALHENQEMIQVASEDDFRAPFFYAQRGIIYAENGHKLKAIQELYTMATFIHKGLDTLKKDGANFVPNSDLNHTGLLVEIPEILQKAFPNDSLVLKQSGAFYKMGLIQFKHCYEGEAFSTKLKNYYHLTIAGLLKTKRLGFASLPEEDLVNTMENIENRLAWKEFIHNRKFAQTPIPDSILNKDYMLRRKLVDARKNNDSEDILDIKNTLKEHKVHLKKTYPILSKSILSEFDIKRFQKQLTDNELVLRYKIIADELFIFKITKSEIDITNLPYTKAFENQLKHYITILNTIDENKGLGHSIFKILFPFNLNKTDAIVIIPDGLFYHLPFETLVTENDEYLVERFRVSYASDLIFIKTNDIGIDRKQHVQLFLPNYSSQASKARSTSVLYGAKEEALYISKLFSSTIYSDSSASKYNFIKQASEATIIHLAMHAKIDNEKPELSYFSFGNSSEEDLYLEELYGLKLNAELAVLSACNTGTGSLRHDKGAVSLQRAFTFSGIPATISSLWEVPDKETSQIMRSFYRHLKNGETKSSALQRAKQEYLENTSDPFLAQPYYWAGFVLNGNTDAVVNKHPTRTYGYLIVILGIIVILIYRNKLI